MVEEHRANSSLGMCVEIPNLLYQAAMLSSSSLAVPAATALGVLTEAKTAVEDLSVDMVSYVVLVQDDEVLEMPMLDAMSPSSAVMVLLPVAHCDVLAQNDRECTQVTSMETVGSSILRIFPHFVSEMLRLCRLLRQDRPKGTLSVHGGDSHEDLMVFRQVRFLHQNLAHMA